MGALENAKGSWMYLRIDVPDGRRYLAALRHTGRGTRRTIRIAGVTFLSSGLVFMLTPLASPWLRLGVQLLGLFWIVCGGALALAPIRPSRDTLNTLVAQPCVFELTEEHVRQTSALHTMQVAWDAITRIEEIPGQMLLFISKRQFFSVPTTGLTGDGLTELREFAASRNADQARPLAGT